MWKNEFFSNSESVFCGEEFDSQEYHVIPVLSNIL